LIYGKQSRGDIHSPSLPLLENSQAILLEEKAKVEPCLNQTDGSDKSESSRWLEFSGEIIREERAAK
jgi:hypothetical protein